MEDATELTHSADIVEPNSAGEAWGRKEVSGDGKSEHATVVILEPNIVIVFEILPNAVEPPAPLTKNSIDVVRSSTPPKDLVDVARSSAPPKDLAVVVGPSVPLP